MSSGERNFTIGPEDPVAVLDFVARAQKATETDYRELALAVKSKLSILAGMLTRWGSFPQEEVYIFGEDGKASIDRRPLVFVDWHHTMGDVYLYPDGQLWRIAKGRLKGEVDNYIPIDDSKTKNPCDDNEYVRYGRQAINKLSILVEEAVAVRTASSNSPSA